MHSVDLLRNVPIFAQLGDDHLDLLNNYLHEQHFERGTMIFHQDSVGNVLYIIVQGQVRIYTVSEFGQELSMRVFHDGDFFGELSLLDGRPRSASATAMNPTRVLTLHRNAFHDIICVSPEIAVTVLEALSSRLRYTNTYVEYLISHSAPQRVVRRLLDLAMQYAEVFPTATRVDLQITQDDLASLVGTSRETVNRVLATLRDQGLIKIERGQVSVLNLALLEQRLDTAQ